MSMTVDLNSDVGESFGVWTLGDDAHVLDHVTSANVACGFHAGDPQVMLATVRAAHDRECCCWSTPGVSRPGRIRTPRHDVYAR